MTTKIIVPPLEVYWGERPAVTFVLANRWEPLFRRGLVDGARRE